MDSTTLTREHCDRSCRSLTFLLLLAGFLSVAGWIAPMTRARHWHSFHAQSPSRLYERVRTDDATPSVRGANDSSNDAVVETNETEQPQRRRVVIVGAGWGGLSAAHALAKDSQADNPRVQVTVLDASPRVGGLVRDGFTTLAGTRPAEAGQHGFWRNYHNIFRLFDQEIDGFDRKEALTAYAKQGQWSPRGLEAVWPVYQDQPLQLPTGLAQAVFTEFINLPLRDKLSAFPLALAFMDFDDSEEAWRKYDPVSFRDLCMSLGVTRRCYEEAFEPMILTGLFAPGAACSAAAALGMAYFFVLQSQSAFDVQWCRGNIGETVFQPWVRTMQDKGVVFACSTKVTGFTMNSDDRITAVKCQSEDGSPLEFEADHVILAVGAKALTILSSFVPNSPVTRICGALATSAAPVSWLRVFFWIETSPYPTRPTLVGDSIKVSV